MHITEYWLKKKKGENYMCFFRFSLTWIFKLSPVWYKKAKMEHLVRIYLISKGLQDKQLANFLF